MQIQKGLVKYKDRSDIVCTYGLTDEGRQYYFLDGNTLANGNIIASTVLVEAIDPVVVASSIGVIDSLGNVVIPFENKSIRLINDDLLLVERANSTTPSVVEAISLRSDPLSATKLVTTAATIKENMNSKMGSEGRFIFNDQFSEATICDINGNNIIDNQYFSFIGMKNNESLYFCKNIIDSDVLEYSLVDRTFIASEVDNSWELDVNNTEVTQDLIDVAMAVEEKVTGFGVEDITAKDFEAVANENVNEVSTVEEVASDFAENQDGVEKTVEVDNSSFDAYSDTENLVEEPVVVEPEKEEMEPKDVSVEENTLGKVDEKAQEVAENISSSVESLNDNNLMSFDFGDNINYSNSVDSFDINDNMLENETEFKNDLSNLDLDTDIFADSMVQVDKIDVDDDYSYKLSGIKENIMEDVASTMTNLIKLNRSQKQKLVAYEEKFDQVVVAHKKIVEKAKSQVREIETLKAKIKNFETIVTKLESKIEVLENKVHDQDKIITSQTSELESLRPQVEGQKELARILADAQLLLEQE